MTHSTKLSLACTQNLLAACFGKKRAALHRAICGGNKLSKKYGSNHTLKHEGLLIRLLSSESLRAQQTFQSLNAFKAPAVFPAAKIQGRSGSRGGCAHKPMINTLSGQCNEIQLLHLSSVEDHFVIFFSLFFFPPQSSSKSG